MYMLEDTKTTGYGQRLIRILLVVDVAHWSLRPIPTAIRCTAKLNIHSHDGDGDGGNVQVSRGLLVVDNLFDFFFKFTTVHGITITAKWGEIYSGRWNRERKTKFLASFWTQRITVLMFTCLTGLSSCSDIRRSSNSLFHLNKPPPLSFPDYHLFLHTRLYVCVEIKVMDIWHSHTTWNLVHSYKSIKNRYLSCIITQRAQLVWCESII